MQMTKKIIGWVSVWLVCGVGNIHLEKWICEWHYGEPHYQDAFSKQLSILLGPFGTVLILVGVTGIVVWDFLEWFAGVVS